MNVQCKYNITTTELADYLFRWKIAEIYKSNKATCLSVLTEEDFFLVNIIHISKIKEKRSIINPKVMRINHHYKY